MKPTYFLLVATIIVGTAYQTAFAQESNAASDNSPSVVERVEHAVERGAHAAANGIERGVKAAASGVKTGAHAAARGVERGAKATANAAKHVADKVSGSKDSDSQE